MLIMPYAHHLGVEQNILEESQCKRLSCIWKSPLAHVSGTIFVYYKDYNNDIIMI